MPESVVLLHGFSGTHRAWDGVVSLLDSTRYRVLALDLPGHGAAATRSRPITFAGCVDAVLAASPDCFTLAGYSLGGRIALHVALAAPERVRRLVLASTSAGIEDASERARRRQSDAVLARELEQGRFEDWVERWRSQPLFADEPEEAGRLARADQRRNDPHALAAVLRGVGAGEMEPLWGRLGELQMPAKVLAGERDRKFVALGGRMAQLLPQGELAVVPGGHGLLLENPAAVADAIRG